MVRSAWGECSGDLGVPDKQMLRGHHTLEHKIKFYLPKIVLYVAPALWRLEAEGWLRVLGQPKVPSEFKATLDCFQDTSHLNTPPNSV